MSKQEEVKPKVTLNLKNPFHAFTFVESYLKSPDATGNGKTFELLTQAMVTIKESLILLTLPKKSNTDATTLGNKENMEQGIQGS